MKMIKTGWMTAVVTLALVVTVQAPAQTFTRCPDRGACLPAMTGELQHVSAHIAGPPTLPSLPGSEFRTRMPLAEQPSGGTPREECEETAVTTGDRIILAQSGCCSFHGGVLGCSGDGRTVCRDGTLSPSCQCSPATDTLTITAGPNHTPNPVASGGVVNLSVTATDSLGLAISYAWSSSCPELPSGGTFNNPNAQNPNWTAPANTTGAPHNCSIGVTVSAGGLTKMGSFTETVNAATPSPQCGTERWSVKTGTDPDAHLVNLSVVTPTTIQTMRSFVPPASLPEDNRVAPVESTVFVLDATLTVYTQEDDSDYHLVLQDTAGNTMITEIPSPSCVGAGSPFAEQIAFARSKFDSVLAATSSSQTANVPVRVTGVGFFDFLHGQTGVAPNSIELHPVLDVVFNPSPSPAFLNLTLNTHTVAVGNLVQVSVTATNSGGAVPMDVYFVIMIPPAAGPSLGCPNGDALAFFGSGFTSSVVTCASAPTQTFPTFLQGMTFPAGLRATVPNFFSLMWPGGVPAGTYTFAILATPPSAFTDGTVDPGDLLTVGFDSLSFSP